MDKQNSKPTKSTEQLILEAAEKEFSVKGFDGARTSAIAAEAGVTHAMLHYYFRSKEKLFERIFQDKLGSIINMVLSPMVDSKGDIKDRIAKGVEAHFDFILANKGLPLFFITTVNSFQDSYKAAFQKLYSTVGKRITAFQKELDKAHKDGKIAKVDAVSLIGDIASLNVFPFLAYPLMMVVFGYEPERFDEYMSARRKENVEIILKRIS